MTAVVREARENEVREMAAKGDVALATETLRKEIEAIRREIVATRGDLGVTTETLRKEIKVVRREGVEVEANLLKRLLIGAVGFQTFVVIGSIFAAIRFVSPA